MTLATPGVSSSREIAMPVVAVMRASSAMTVFVLGSVEDNLRAEFKAGKLSDLNSNDVDVPFENRCCQARAATSRTMAPQRH